eukprot:2420632-Prymnesium_polylepis.1
MRGCGTRSRRSWASTNVSPRCRASIMLSLLWGWSTSPDGFTSSSCRPSLSAYLSCRPLAWATTARRYGSARLGRWPSYSRAPRASSAPKLCSVAAVPTIAVSRRVSVLRSHRGWPAARVAVDARPHLPCASKHVDENLQDLYEAFQYDEHTLRRYLYADLTLLCDSDEYEATRTTAFVSFVMLALWPVGTPLLYARHCCGRAATRSARTFQPR